MIESNKKQTRIYTFSEFTFDEDMLKNQAKRLFVNKSNSCPYRPIRTGDLVVTTAQSAAHPAYITNTISNRFLMVGKVSEYIEETEKDSNNNIVRVDKSFRVRFGSIRTVDGQKISSEKCGRDKQGLIPANECARVATRNSPLLDKIDPGTAYNVHITFKFNE